MGEANAIRQMSGLELFASRTLHFMVRQRRRFLPYFVWYGDELDVRVVFTADKLPPIEGRDLDDALGQAVAELQSSPLVQTEDALRRLGVSFDTGMGAEGRDWEWDFSLRGPISVKFKGRAAHPERRMGRANA